MLCHCSGVSFIALLWKVLWDWPKKGTGRELAGGIGKLFDFCTTEDTCPPTVQFTESCSRERILFLDAFEDLRPNSFTQDPE